MDRHHDLDVYSYHSAQDFLKAVHDRLKNERPQYSLRAWSRHLGVTDPGTMSRILTGRRKIPKSAIPKIIQALGLDEQEAAYFEFLVHGPFVFSRSTFELLRDGARMKRGRNDP